MAETNIDKVAEKIERREIKRNFSNQIISYGLPEDGKLKYGYKKLPAVTTRYDRESYNNTIDGLSDELLSTRGDLGITEQSLNYIKYSESIVEDEFVDTFSGRYAITKDAKTPIGRDSWSGYKNHHILNIYQTPSAPNNKDDKARNFRFGGLETVPFDDVEKGPNLKNGGYVITPELIDSGKSIKLTVIMGIGNELIDSNGILLNRDVNFKLKFNRIRKPYAANVSEDIGNTLIETVPRGSYAFLKLEFDVLNSKMEEGDIWELQGMVSTAYRGVFFYADKSIFKVDVIDTPTTPAKQVPKTSDRLLPKPPEFRVSFRDVDSDWTGGKTVNPTTGALILTKGNSTTMPVVTYPTTTNNNPIVSDVGIETIPPKVPTEVTISNITVPSGYSNAGDKLSFKITIDTNYRPQIYYQNLERIIRNKLDNANGIIQRGLGTLENAVSTAQATVDLRQRELNAIGNRLRDQPKRIRANARLVNAKRILLTAQYYLNAARIPFRAQARKRDELRRNYKNRRKG